MKINLRWVLNLAPQRQWCFSSPLSRLELTKPICLCESAEKYSSFIRVKGHGIGQWQRAEVFSQLSICTAGMERRPCFHFPFMERARFTLVKDVACGVHGHGCWTRPLSSAVNVNKCANGTNQRALQCGGCWQLGKVKRKLYFLLIKSKKRKPPPSPSIPTATTLARASWSIGICVGVCSPWLTT